MIKKKSFDTTSNEQQQTIETHQHLVQSFSNPSSLVIEHSDHQLNELSVDSYESVSPVALTPPPAKPPRQNDESGSSSSIEINSPPPAKPPRHFSVYKKNDNHGLIQQTDNAVKKVLNLVDTFGLISRDDSDMNILRQTPSNSNQMINLQTADSLKNVETFTGDPIQIIINTDVPLITKSFDTELKKPMTITSFSSPIVDTKASIDNKLSDEIVSPEITQLAINLTKNIVEEVKKELGKQNQSSNHDSIINNDRILQQPTNKTIRDITPPFPQPIVITHISPTQSTSRPLMFVSLDSESNNTTKAFSPLLDIVTTKSTPLFTTSVTVISPQTPLVSSITTVTNSDDDLNSSAALIPKCSVISDHSKVLPTRNKQNSLDFSTYDNTVFLPQNIDNATPERSFLSDYDNLHGSDGSLNDDNQQTQIRPPPLPSSSDTISSTVSSSMSTIYESLDNFPSTTTSPTFVSAVSTFGTSGTTTPSGRLNSDISDDDLGDSFDIDRSSEGRKHRIQIIPSTDIMYFSWHVFNILSLCFYPSPVRLAWANQFASLEFSTFLLIHLSI
jgi:hypothetical protein